MLDLVNAITSIKVKRKKTDFQGLNLGAEIKGGSFV